MTIAPIVRTVEVKAAPDLAFELFASRIGDWWPKGGGIGKAPCVDVIIEPRDGGRWFERDSDGGETDWGRVLVWAPPKRLVLVWQLTTDWTFDPNLLTEVELTFRPSSAGGSIVTLEHRHLERFGKAAADHAASIGRGWPARLDQFANFADAQA